MSVFGALAKVARSSNNLTIMCNISSASITICEQSHIFTKHVLDPVGMGMKVSKPFLEGVIFSGHRWRWPFNNHFGAGREIIDSKLSSDSGFPGHHFNSLFVTAYV